MTLFPLFTVRSSRVRTTMKAIGKSQKNNQECSQTEQSFFPPFFASSFSIRSIFNLKMILQPSAVRRQSALTAFARPHPTPVQAPVLLHPC